MRIIKLKINDIKCHPAAEDAYIFSMQQRVQFDLSTLETEKLATVIQPLPLIVLDCDNYHFVSGWAWINDKTTAAINVNKTLTNSEIEIIAWKYVINSLQFCWHRKTNLKSASDLLWQLSECLGIKHKSIKKLVQQIANESRSAIRYQVDRKK